MGSARSGTVDAPAVGTMAVMTQLTGQLAPGGWSPPASPPTPPQQALDYPVFYHPAPAVERWHRLRRSLFWGIVSLVISVGIWVAIWWFNRDALWDSFWWWAGINIGISVLLLGWTVLRLVLARRAIAALHEGLALGIGRGGLYAADTFLLWPALAGVEARPGRLGGSARLLLRPAVGQPIELPLDYLSQSPAAIDGAVRAMSGGRVWIDLSRLDD